MNVTTTEHAAQVTNLRGSLHWLCLPPFSTNIPVPTMHQVHTQLKAMSYHPAFPVGRAWSFTLITSSPDCHRSLFFTSSPYPKSIPPTNPMWTNNTSRRINRLLCNLEVWSLLKQIQTPASLGHFIFLWLKYTWYKMYSFHLLCCVKLSCPAHWRSVCACYLVTWQTVSSLRTGIISCLPSCYVQIICASFAHK